MPGVVNITYPISIYELSKNMPSLVPFLKSERKVSGLTILPWLGRHFCIGKSILGTGKFLNNILFCKTPKIPVTRVKTWSVMD